MEKPSSIGETVASNVAGNTERYVKKFNSLVSTHRFLRFVLWNTRIEVLKQYYSFYNMLGILI